MRARAHARHGWARKIIAAFARPENAKKGVIVVEGRRVERLHLSMAMRTAMIAEQIRAMDLGCV
jgi:citrate lyase subunit beta/citryl-CoA lyase